jgi:hypothetical protein
MMHRYSALGLRYGPRLLALVLLMFISGCQLKPSHSTPPLPTRDINVVLAEHDDRLLGIPGVVGVYVGLLEDGRTECLRVMLAHQTPENERAIPKSLEGYPIVVEVTGEIRPLDKP